jgi:4-aminobutyrate aminotransferase/(S)-3-amino-2-methylpropionate transaminase
MLPEIKTDVPGPKSLELWRLRERHVARGVSSSTKIFAAKAEGAVVTDVDGNSFLDFASGIGVANVGHCPREVVEAAQAQLKTLIHASVNVTPYEPYARLAERLCALSPIKGAKAFFINSGAEAVENAVKLAKKSTGRTGIAVVDGSFHGRTLLAMSMTSKAKPYKEGFGPFAPDIHRIPCPNAYRGEGSEEEIGLRCADAFEEALQTTLSPESVACAVIEPVQGEGGFIPMPRSFVVRMREICSKHGILLIVDEIQCGIARTGTLFAIEQTGVEPDLLTSSKSLAAGFPLSAVVGRSEIMDAAGPGSIGGTFGGNPVACAAALAVLDMVEKQDLAGKARLLGNFLRGRLLGLKDRHEAVGDARGVGAMLGIELVKDKKTKEPDKALVDRVCAAALKKGAIFISAGMLSNVVRVLPPLVMDLEQAAYGMDVLDQSLSEALE